MSADTPHELDKFRGMLADDGLTDEQFAELVEAQNSPSAKRIAELERELAQARAQRDQWRSCAANLANNVRWRHDSHPDNIALAKSALAEFDRLKKENP